MNGGAVPTPQLVGGVLTGHTSGPKRSLTGAICSPAGSPGEQPLPSHAASKSTDRRLAPTEPNMEMMTQFWLVVREPRNGGAGPVLPKPTRCAVYAAMMLPLAVWDWLLRLRNIQPPTSVPPRAGNFVVSVVLVDDVSGSERTGG